MISRPVWDRAPSAGNGPRPRLPSARSRGFRSSEGCHDAALRPRRAGGHRDRPIPPGPIGTWTIDHAHSSVSLTWRRLRLGTVTGRLHGLGIIHLDDLPPVGVVRFQQPSRLPVLTMALDPASVETGDARLDTLLCGPDAFDVTRHRWWTLRSESLELLPTGTWRLTATLTARGTAGLVELRSEAEASDHDTLILRGQGVLDRRTLSLGKPSWTRSPRVRLDLELYARRVVTRGGTQQPWPGS